MNRRLLILSLLVFALTAVAQVGELPRSTPEAEGVDTALLNHFYHAITALPQVDVHHLMVLRHGKVIGELHATPYQADQLHTLSAAITAKSSYIEELDLTELNVVKFYNSGSGAGGDNFLGNLGNVKKIILPESLEIVSEGAFSTCRNLEEVVFHDYVTDILWSGFAYCNKLKEVTLPDSLEFIAQTAFYNCNSLEHVHLSKNSNLEIIGLRAFYTCNKLEEFYFPPKLTYLDNRHATTGRGSHGYGTGQPSTSGAFDHCTALTTLKFSKGIIRIHQNTFMNCPNISEVYYEGTEAEWRTINIGTNNGRLSNWESEVAAGTLTMHFEAEYPLYP